jgi:hypothetical protein
LLYLYIIVAGTFAALFVRGRLVASGDAEATARNIQDHETLFRVGFTGELLHIACDVAVAVILYALLRPVDRYLSLLAALFRLTADIILAIASVSHFATLRLLSGADYLQTLLPEQRHTLALLAMKLQGDTYAICLWFFAFACLSAGYLIFKSGYLPKAVGALLALAGVCYAVNSLAHFLSPPFAALLDPAIYLPIFVAELSLALWLLVKGVDRAGWPER